jgi:single-stranded DNA-binding protein
MIDALVTGKVFGAPAQKVGKSGKPFAVCKVRAPMHDGESIFINVIAFDQNPCAALMGLGDGDAVALAGLLTPKVWTDREGVSKPALDMVAQQVMSPYQLKRKRDSQTGGQQ